MGVQKLKNENRLAILMTFLWTVFIYILSIYNVTKPYIINIDIKKLTKCNDFNWLIMWVNFILHIIREQIYFWNPKSFILIL